MSTSIKTIRIVLDTTQAQTNSNALNTTVNNTTNSTTNLNNSINTTNRTINRFDNSVNTTNRTINRYVTNIRQASNATNSLNSDVNHSLPALNKMYAAIKGIIVAAGAINAIKGIAAISDEYAKITGLLRNATDSQESFNSALELSKKTAEETKAPLTVTVETFAALNRVTQGLGKSQSDLFRILTTINKAVASTSPNAAAAASALTQFGQALGGDFKGSSQELNSILELTPGLAQAVAKGLGVPTKALKKMAEEGKLSTDLVIAGLEAVESEVDAKFEKIPKTISTSMQAIRNDMLATLGDAKVADPIISSLEDLRATLKDPATSEGIITIASAFVKLVEWGAKAASLFASLGKNIGYFAASVSGNVSEIEKLEKQLERLSRNDFVSRLNEAFTFRNRGESKDSEIENIKARIALFNKEHGVYVQTAEEKEKIAKDKKISDGIDAVFEKEKAVGEVERLKRLNDEKAAQKELGKERERNQKSVDREIASLKELVNNTGQSKQVEIKYKLEVLGASKKEIDEALVLAKRLDEIENEKKIKKATEKFDDEITNARDTTADLQAELDTRLQVSQFYREANLKGARDSFERERALLNAKEQEQIAQIDQRATEDAQRRNEKLREALEIENLSEPQIAALREQYRNQELTAEQIYEAQRTAIKEDGIRTREELDRLEFMARLQSFGALGSSLMSLGEGQSKKVFEVGKALALAQAAVSLPIAVIEAVKNSGGLPWGAVAGAATLAMGLKNIQMIKAAKFGGGGAAGGAVGGGGSGGGSASVPTTSGGGNEEQFRQRQVIEIRGIGPDSLITGSQLAEILGRDDNVVVALAGAQADAQRRGVI